MKEIADESVVKNIIGINLNNKRNVPYFKIIINDGIVFLIFRKLLDIANTLVEFFRYANYDNDKKIRLFEYREDLSSYYLNIEDVDYYYFNRERQKELVKH